MKKTIFCIILLFVSTTLFCQSEVKIVPYFRQGGMYFSSDYVTSVGYGTGFGIALQRGKHLLSEADINIYWLNGNAMSTRLSTGYKKDGLWSPSVMANVSFFYGSHTEVLLENGSSPKMPVFSVGLKISPLRFENDKGFVSVLEFGFGFGQDNAKVPELTLMSFGIKL